MARDEEFRRVAEDIRALGRSLARDLREAAETAHRSGRPPAAALRDSWRNMSDEMRSAARDGFGRPGGRGRHHRGRGWAGPYWWPGAWGCYSPPGDRNAAGDGAAGDGAAGDGAAGDGAAGSAAPGDSAAGAAAPRQGAERGWPGRYASRGGRFGSDPGDLREAERRSVHRRDRNARRGRPPVRRRWDGPGLVVLLVAVLGGAWLLGSVHAVSVPLEAALAAGLIALGLAVVVTARTDWSLSRQAWPLLAGAAMMVVLVTASSGLGVGPALRHVSFGTMSAEASPGRTIYGGMGTLHVDATKLAPGASVSVESVAGTTTVMPPPGVGLDIHARVLAGEICVFGVDAASGANATYSAVVRTGPSASFGSPVELSVRQVAGKVQIGSQSCQH